MSLVVDFLTVNFVKKTSFSYVSLHFSFNHVGHLKEKELSTCSIVQISLDTIGDMIFAIIICCLAITLIFFSFGIAKHSYYKSKAYNRWV
jgi:hypothetical protein